MKLLVYTNTLLSKYFNPHGNQFVKRWSPEEIDSAGRGPENCRIEIPMNYFVCPNGKQEGPFSEQEIKQKLIDGKILLSDLAWKDGMVEWQNLSTLLNIPIKTYSMTIKITCPHCGQHIEAPGEAIGTVVSCPACNKQFHVKPKPVKQVSPMSPARQSFVRQPTTIILGICLVVFMFTSWEISSLEQRAAPAKAELDNMSSGSSLVGYAVEGFARGAMGDRPWGLSSEIAQRQRELQAQIDAAIPAMESASGWRTFSVLVGFITLAVMGWKHWRSTRKAKKMEI